MKTAAVEGETLKLTVAEDGRVWYLDGVGLPAPSGLDDEQFLEAPVVRKARRVRVVGSAANARLIIALHRRKQAGELESLEVCSPLVCESAAGRKDPELVLFYMRTFSLCPSLGGWRELTEQDLLTYELAVHIETYGRVTREAIEMAENHPVWPALQFIPHLREDEATKLLAIIIDPRWYIDQDDPNRLGQLERYLGLNPATAEAVSKGNIDVWMGDRYLTVLSCWLGHTIKMGRSVGKSTTVAAQGLLLMQDPRHFLMRIYIAKDFGSKGLLAACKKFIGYLRHNWLNEVAGHKGRGRLFVPEHFFEKPEEAVAYRDHMNLLRKRK